MTSLLISETLPTVPSLPDLPSHGTEYCFMEHFGASCAAGKHVRVLWALLGRMRQGRCITDSDNLECYDDVSQHLRDQCAEQRDCRVYVGSMGQMTTSCPTNMMSYLHADYDCVDGKPTSVTNCFKGFL